MTDLLIAEIVALKADLEMLKTAFGNSAKVGAVEEVDAAKGFRLKLGEDDQGKPYLSPWYPHPESGGATKTWAPLTKGQIVGVVNPIGDQRQGFVFRAGFSDQNPAPSQDLAANVFSFGGVTVTISGGKMTVEGDLQVTGSSLKHNSKNVGDSHVHGGIVVGPADTDVPSN